MWLLVTNYTTVSHDVQCARQIAYRRAVEKFTFLEEATRAKTWPHVSISKQKNKSSRRLHFHILPKCLLELRFDDGEREEQPLIQ